MQLQSLKRQIPSPFEQGVPRHSDNYRVSIHFETRIWHDNNIQSNIRYRIVLTTQLNHLGSSANGWVFVYGFICCGVKSSCIISATDFVPVSRKEFLWLQSTTECGFTLKLVQTMTRRYSQMQRTDKCSQRSSVIWQVWLNGWMFAYKLSGCVFVSSCGHLNFRFIACFKQDVHWYSGN